MIRIAIAEDQKLLRDTLVKLLKMEDDIEVVCQSGDGQEALDAIRRLNPDVCLLDIELPLLSGLEIARLLRSEGHPARLIMVTTFARAGYLQQATELKVEGYLLKDEPIDDVLEAIRKVAKTGERVVSKELAAALFAREAAPLTERELDVLRLSHRGFTTDEIAGQLHLTVGTVRNYLSLGIQKLGVQTRQQATDKARENGWL
ncbi:response regulator transcription factor [Paenibacillus daejeonensis]|uniref:response regulator transcription factor n=1 Tax=Paenibacillus daejeonensis TaxID=135193 RepID=UPI00038233A2|nr:response regulator transcription factor [Paenibacillus daejeonensis]